LLWVTSLCVTPATIGDGAWVAQRRKAAQTPTPCSRPQAWGRCGVVPGLCHGLGRLRGVERAVAVIRMTQASAARRSVGGHDPGGQRRLRAACTDTVWPGVPGTGTEVRRGFTSGRHVMGGVVRPLAGRPGGGTVTRPWCGHGGGTTRQGQARSPGLPATRAPHTIVPSSGIRIRVCGATRVQDG